MFYITSPGHQLHSIPELPAFLQGPSSLSLLSIFKNRWQARRHPLLSYSAPIHLSQKSYPGVKHIYNNRNNKSSERKTGWDSHLPTHWPESQEKMAPKAAVTAKHHISLHMPQLLSNPAPNSSFHCYPRPTCESCSLSQQSTSILVNLVNPIPCTGSRIQTWTFSTSLAVHMH